MVIEIVTQAAHHMPEGTSLHIGYGTPYLIPPEALIDIPAAQHTTSEKYKPKEQQQTLIFCSSFFHFLIKLPEIFIVILTPGIGTYH